MAKLAAAFPGSHSASDVAIASRTDGFIYFVQGEGVSAIKIGFATSPKVRLDSLQCGSPVRLKFIGLMHGTMDDEKRLHDRFRKHRLHGEWFSATPEIMHEAALHAVEQSEH